MEPTDNTYLSQFIEIVETHMNSLIKESIEPDGQINPDKYNEIIKFCNDIDCVLNTLNNINNLKNVYNPKPYPIDYQNIRFRRD